jgi:membrane associated rhomboid family serine protease
MARNASVVGGLPPFRGALRNIVIASTAIYIALVMLQAFQPGLAAQVYAFGILTSQGVRHGAVWQLLTYGFMELDPKSFLFSMLSIYFLGSAVQERIGSKPFYELYFSSLIFSGLFGFALSFTGVIGLGPALGAGAAANAVLMVFYLLNRDAPIMLMFIPIPIPVKYIVIFGAAVEGAYFLISHFILYYTVLLLGLVTGYLWYRFAWKRAAIFGGVGNRVGDIRNSYHLWKRRRAGKKFQVYMKKHDQDAKDYFDEYGNFRPPDDKDKKNGGSTGGGWVN